jgi:hypothetical protein
MNIQELWAIIKIETQAKGIGNYSVIS